MTESHFVFSYSNPCSVDDDANRDWEIGKNSGLVGCGIPCGLKNHTWVLWKRDKTKYNIGYTGKLIEKEEKSQPWYDAGGKEWKYVYRCTQHIFLGDLDTFCKKHSFDRKIFTNSLCFGHARLEYLHELTRAAEIVMS
jgi:hypothetical protein